MEVDADDHEGAARKALEIMRDPESMATVFTVVESIAAVTKKIDLDEIDQERGGQDE